VNAWPGAGNWREASATKDSGDGRCGKCHVALSHPAPGSRESALQQRPSGNLAGADDDDVLEPGSREAFPQMPVDEVNQVVQNDMRTGLELPKRLLTSRLRDRHMLRERTASRCC
jgi:hypothetical protein